MQFGAAGEEVGYDAVRYTRCNNNPSQEVVAAKLAALEGGKIPSRVLLCGNCGGVLAV